MENEHVIKFLYDHNKLYLWMKLTRPKQIYKFGAMQEYSCEYLLCQKKKKKEKKP